LTVSSTATFELDVSGIIRRGMQVAGLLEASQQPSDADEEMARDFVNLELDELQAEGDVQRTWTRTTLPLVAGTSTYSLDSDCVDVFVGPDNVVGTIVPSSGAETPVTVMSRHEYVSKSDKTSQSTPTRVMVERTATIKLVFWPVPPTSPGSFRYQKGTLMRDANPTNYTPDIDRKRAKALIWAVAYDMAVAKKMGIDRVGMLRAERDRLKAVARANDVERGHAQFYVAH